MVAEAPVRIPAPEQLTPSKPNYDMLGGLVVALVVVYLVMNRVFPDRFVVPFGVSVRPYEIVLMLLLCCWAIWMVVDPKPLPTGLLGLVGLLLFSVLLLAPMLHLQSLSPFQASGAERGIMRVILFAGLFLASYHLARRLKWARIVLGAVIAVAVLQAVLAVWEFQSETPMFFFDDLALSLGLVDDSISLRGEFDDVFLRLTGEIRAVGTAPHPIVLSASIALAIMAAAGWLVNDESRWRRVWLLIATGALLIGLPTTNSRTGYVMLVVAFLPLAVLALKRVSRLVPLVAGGAVFMGVAFALSPQTPRLLLNTFTRPDEDHNLQVRVERFDVLTEMLAQHPFIGRGYLTHDPTIQIFDNAYNLALVEVGMVGLTLFVAFFSLVVVRCWSAFSRAGTAEAPILFAGVVGGLGLLIAGITIDAWTFDQFLPAALVLMGLGVGRARLVDERRPIVPRAVPPSFKPVAAPARQPKVAASPVPASRPRVATVAFTRYDSDPRVRRMAEALAESGGRVTAIVIEDPGQPRLRLVEGVTVISLPFKQYRGTSTVRYLTQYLVFATAAAWRITRLHFRNRFDVIHINNLPDFMVIAALPAKLFGASVILDIHDPMPELFMSKFNEKGSKFVVGVVEAAEKVSIGVADRVISVHDVQLETLLSRGYRPDKFLVVQNMPDERFFPRAAAIDGGPTEHPTIMYHGLIAPRLGIDVAVRAMRMVNAEVPGARLVLIGDGDGADEIEQLISELRLGDVVEFRRGFVPVEELLPHLVQADIGIVPARNDPFTANMLPTKLVEYVTLGIPVISTELPAVTRYFQPEQVLMVPDGDVIRLAGAIIELAQDPLESRQRAIRALEFLDDINWEGEKARYLSLIDELVARDR